MFTQIVGKFSQADAENGRATRVLLETRRKKVCQRRMLGTFSHA
jgi:hypothetical protein